MACPPSLAPSWDTIPSALARLGPMRVQSAVCFERREHVPEKMTCADEEISYKLAEYSIELDDKKRG